MLERKPHYLLVAFLLLLVVLNAWRLEQWGAAGFRVYLTHAIMQTTLVDFACVLGVVVFFIRRDANQAGVSWWWILSTFPFMPTLGLLAYFIVRRRKLLAREATSFGSSQADVGADPFRSPAADSPSARRSSTQNITNAPPASVN